MESISNIQRPLTPISSGSSCGMSDVDPYEGSSAKGALRTALHVIRTERDALTALEDLYESDGIAQEGLADAVTAISASISGGGRLIVSGVGKSAKIAKKMVATMNSFGIRSIFLHPTEALHGDLGMIGDKDVILIITFSGRTPELLSLMKYLAPSLPVIAMSSHTDPSTCPILYSRPCGLSILLPAPIPHPEVESFGVAAPTTSTTVALTLADALALAVARRLHPSPAAVFKGYHPGGAIGVANRMEGIPMGVGSVTLDGASVVTAIT